MRKKPTLIETLRRHVAAGIVGEKITFDVTPEVAETIPTPRQGSFNLKSTHADGTAINWPGSVCYTRRRLKNGLVRLFVRAMAGRFE